MSFSQFHCRTRVVCEVGLAKDFSAELGRLGAQKFLVVTDAFLKKSGVIDPILAGLNEQGFEVCGVFSDVPPDGSVTAVAACAVLARESGAEALIVIGGGSVIDTAKAANILFTHGGDLQADYAGAQTLPGALKPLVAIPTTAGTGSEVTGACVLYDDAAREKLSFSDENLAPDLAILDPELTVGLPVTLTIATGLDALTHAIEAVVSVQHNPFSDALALQAIALIRSSLMTAVVNGGDLSARENLLMAATLAGLAFQHAMVGVVHAVAHSVGAVSRVHHGAANGIFLACGLEYNLSEAADRIALLAPSFGVEKSGGDQETALTVIASVRAFVAGFHAHGFPKNYQAAGVRREDLPLIAKKAEDDGASFYNSRVVSATEILPFLERAWG